MTEEQLKELVRMKQERDEKRDVYEAAMELERTVKAGLNDQIVLRLGSLSGPRKAAGEAYVSTYISLAGRELDEAEERFASALKKFGERGRKPVGYGKEACSRYQKKDDDKTEE